MRQVASILLCCVTLCAGAADIWRWRDANGVVHYSDNYRPGAERVNVNVTPPSGDAAPAEASAPFPETAPQETAPATVRYRSCTIQAPANDEVFFGVQPVDVSVGIDPGLQPGHRVSVLYDGTPVANWPAGSTRSSIPEVFRGTHTLSVRVLDANGRTVCSGSSITFHLRQASVLSPLRQPGQPTATPAPGVRPPGG